jgi:hypothetical protein
MTRSHFNEMKSLIDDIEKYVDNNSTKIVLYKIFEKPLRFLIRVLKASYYILNKGRIRLETQKMFEQLKEYNIKLGDLIEIKETTIAFTESISFDSANSRPQKVFSWKHILPGEIVMFVGIENDTFNDEAILKVLCADTIFYITKDPKISHFDNFLRTKFSKV